MKVELDAVVKHFDGHAALRGVSFVVESGERVALVGPNGSGKSTLLRAIMGLLRCEGRLRLDGRCPFEHRDVTAHELAYVPQIAPQLGASVDEVVGAVGALRGLDPARVVAEAKGLELQLSEIGDKPFRALSGGMKQKLLLALAFASRARLFIFDEPTASLDAAARERFSARLAVLDPDSTVLVCSHRFEEVQPFVGRVVELVDGVVARDLRCVQGPAVIGATSARGGSQ